MSKKTHILSVRFTDKDAEVIDKISKKEGMWASAWVRSVVIEQLVKLGIRKKSINHISEYGR